MTVTPATEFTFLIDGEHRVLARRTAEFESALWKHAPMLPESYIDYLAQCFGRVPGQFEQIMRSIHWSGLTGCWLFNFMGMTVGMELDGYTHT